MTERAIRERSVTEVRDNKLMLHSTEVPSTFAQKLISLKAALCISQTKFNPSTDERARVRACLFILKRYVHHK